ncbi:DnaJ domain-containing protein [Chloropicon primus]|nr:DnaJ domain-containing protein [Chloropicon primus]
MAVEEHLDNNNNNKEEEEEEEEEEERNSRGHRANTNTKGKKQDEEERKREEEEEEERERERNPAHDTLGYYAKLNLSPDCTEEQVKQQYRRLVRFYHPDKVEQLKKELDAKGKGREEWGDEEQEEEEEEGEIKEGKRDLLNEAATASFGKLQAAYETLSDPVARAIYDTYGGDGLAAGREIVQVDDNAPSSLRKVREEIEKTKLKEEILRDIRKNGMPEQYGRVRYSGLYHMSLAPSSRRRRAVSQDEGRGGGVGLASLLDLLEVGVISLNSNVTVQATDKDTLMFGGQIGQSMKQPSRGSNGSSSQGSLSVTMRREVSPVSTLELSAQCQLEPGTRSSFHSSVKSVRQLTKDDSASWEVACTSTPVGDESGVYDHELELEICSTRRLGEKTFGEFAWRFDPTRVESGMSLTFSKQAKMSASSFDIHAGKVMGFSGYSSRVVSLPLPGTRGEDGKKKRATFVGKASFKARTDALDLEVAASKKVPKTQLNLGWGAAISHRGLFWRLRANHLGQRFFIPICLTSSFTLPNICATFAVPPILAGLGRLAFSPLQKWYAAMQNESDAEESNKKLCEVFQIAASDCVLMVGPALRKRKASYNSGGLVIVQAIYGDVESFREEGNKQEEGGSREYRWLDVVIPLQFMCRNDKLVIHSGIRKHQLMGFCEPAAKDDEEDGHRLLVRYLYNSKFHECVVSDMGSLNLPYEGHAMQDGGDLEASLKARSEELEEETAEDLIKALIKKE